MPRSERDGPGKVVIVLLCIVFALVLYLTWLTAEQLAYFTAIVLALSVGTITTHGQVMAIAGAIEAVTLAITVLAFTRYMRKGRERT